MKRFFSWLMQAGCTIIALPTSLLPLSAMLLFFPALYPQESVLNEATTRGSFFRRVGRRLFSVAVGFAILIGLLAISTELVTLFAKSTGTTFLSERGQFEVIARKLLPAPMDFAEPLLKEEEKAERVRQAEGNIGKEFYTVPLYKRLPPALAKFWPVVFFVMYLLDIVVLLFLGKVPLRYNLRNLRVRWLTNAMTAVVFVFVIGLLVVLLAFVSGMNNLTENTGAPGNVFVLSDGSNDEVFSNLGYGDLDNVERERATLDENNRELGGSVGVATVKNKSNRTAYLASKETYFSINQAIPLKPGEWESLVAKRPELVGRNPQPQRRRFIQLRALEDPDIAAAVHDVELLSGGSWFSKAGVDDDSRIQCVLGEGVAGVLGEDFGKKRLGVGDEFELGDMRWVVTGIMKSAGKTFGSEVWAKKFDRVCKPFGKDNFTTLVLRTDANNRAASTALAYHLSKRYTLQKLKALSEPDYYSELGKTSNDYLIAIVFVAVAVSIGGVFGMMTTMFASIAQRIRDIGVLRLLGFKRWQVMISFMLESLAVSLIGGALGCLLVRIVAQGKESVSLGGGGGGGPSGKSSALTLDVGFEVVLMGLLFALMMGRLGGLIPSLSAMRMKILDSLR